uniref:dCMP deaminase n=1 Tax=Sinocyclocheilus rhinocerous TaxID=307959 RepID=A0A673MLV4_9TELE
SPKMIVVSTEMLNSLTKKRQDYLEWPEYFMAVAFLSAQRSKDPSSQEWMTTPKYPCMGNSCSDSSFMKVLYMCHAELNAIMNKNSADVKGCTMYVALFPCNECTKLIIQAGIKDVIYLSDKYHDTPEMTASRRLLNLNIFFCVQQKKEKSHFILGDFNYYVLKFKLIT